MPNSSSQSKDVRLVHLLMAGNAGVGAIVAAYAVGTDNGVMVISGLATFVVSVGALLISRRSTLSTDH